MIGPDRKCSAAEGLWSDQTESAVLQTVYGLTRQKVQCCREPMVRPDSKSSAEDLCPYQLESTVLQMVYGWTTDGHYSAADGLWPDQT